MPLHSNEKIRDTLYNIEQFKFDAMLAPELKVKVPGASSASSGSSTTISTGALSATGSSVGPVSLKLEGRTKRDPIGNGPKDSSK